MSRRATLQTRGFSKYLLCVMGLSMLIVNAYATPTDANISSSKSTQEASLSH